MALLLERGLWVVIVLCTSCKPVIRLSILAEKGQLKILRGCMVQKKIWSGGVGELRLSLLLSLVQPTQLAIFFPFTSPMSLVPAYQAIHLFNIHYLSKITVKMHIHRCITIIFNSLNHMYSKPL